MTEKISERSSYVLELPLINVIITRVLSTDAAMLAAQDLVESLQHTTPNAPFATINDTNHTLLIIMEGIFNIMT